MTISVVGDGARKARGSGSSISLNMGGVGSNNAGLLAVVVLGCYRSTTGVSTGWTEFAATGSTGQYVRAAWRILDDTDNDDITYSFSGSGQAMMLGAFFQSTIGFDATAITQSQRNVTVTSADTYALSGSLSGVTSGQLSVVMGGESYTAQRPLTPGVSGTNWSPTYGPNTFDYGHATIATNSVNTGTIPTPTITYNDTFSSIKFVVGFVLKETAASGLAGGGLFWGQ